MEIVARKNEIELLDSIAGSGLPHFPVEPYRNDHRESFLQMGLCSRGSRRALIHWPNRLRKHEITGQKYKILRICPVKRAIAALLWQLSRIALQGLAVDLNARFQTGMMHGTI